MLEKTVLALVILCCLTTLSAKTLRMAVFQLDPFMMTDRKSKELTGVTVEYWKRFLAPTMGHEIQVVGPYPIKRAEKMLENGEVDVVSQLTKIPEREAIFLYPETHLTTIKSCLVVLPESTITSVRAKEDLYDMKIGFIKSGYIPEMLIDPKISIEKVGNEDFRQINLNKLFSNRVDAMLDINQVSLEYYLKERNYYNKVKIVKLPVPDVKVYSIFQKSPQGRALRDSFDTANRKGLAQKKFKTITAEFLSRQE